MPRTKSMSRAANGNGTIRKKTVMKNGKKYIYWEARCTVGYDPGTGKQIQRSISGKTQKEVAQKLKQMSLDVDNGTYQEPSNLTVKDWFEIWQKDYMGDVKASTKLLYSRNVDLYIVPNLGAVKAASPGAAQGRPILLLQAQEQQNPNFDACALCGEIVPASKTGTERKAAQSGKELDRKGPCIFQ